MKFICVKDIKITSSINKRKITVVQLLPILEYSEKEYAEILINTTDGQLQLRFKTDEEAATEYQRILDELEAE